VQAKRAFQNSGKRFGTSSANEGEGFTVCAPVFPARISAPARTESFFITFDNANGDEQDQVFTGVIGPGVDKSVKVGTHYRHENTLRTMMEFPQRDSTWAQRERQKYSSQAAWDRVQEIVHEAGFNRKPAKRMALLCQFARRSWLSAQPDQDGLPIFCRE